MRVTKLYKFYSSALLSLLVLIVPMVMLNIVGCGRSEDVPVEFTKDKKQSTFNVQNCAEKFRESAFEGLIPFINTSQTTVDDGADSFNFWLRDRFGPAVYWGIYNAGHELEALKIEKSRTFGLGDGLEVITTVISSKTLEIRYRKLKLGLPALYFVQKFELTGTFPKTCDLSIKSVERVDFSTPPVAEKQVKKLKMVARQWQQMGTPEKETVTEGMIDLIEGEQDLDLLGFYFPRVIQRLGNPYTRIFDFKNLTFLKTKLVKGEEVVLNLPTISKGSRFTTYNWSLVNTQNPSAPVENRTLFISKKSRHMVVETTDSTEVFMNEVEWLDQAL
jgi:hypothetical protein